MSADKHRQPGDADKHLQDWRTRSLTTEEADIGDSNVVVIDKDGQIHIPTGVGLFFGDGDGGRIIGQGGGGSSDIKISDTNGNNLRIKSGSIETGTDIQCFGGEVNLQGNPLKGFKRSEYNPVDVRNLGSPVTGLVAYHNGSGSNTEGLAAYNGTDWISQVDGSTIA
jgi:hypothetical protein